MPSQIIDAHSEHLVVPNTAENKQMIQGYAQQYMKEISTLLVRMPRPLLLLLKTNDCLRAVDYSLVRIAWMVNAPHGVALVSMLHGATICSRKQTVFPCDLML